MGLKEQLEELQSKSNPMGLCLVGLWASKLPDEEQKQFNEVMADLGIAASDILKVTGQTDFKRTTLVLHRRGECSCQN